MTASDYMTTAEETTPQMLAVNPAAFDLQGWWNSLSGLQQVLIVAIPIVLALMYFSGEGKRVSRKVEELL